MKIAVISPEAGRLQDIGRQLEGLSRSVSLIQGDSARMRAVAEQEQPQLMLVEGARGDAALAQIAQLTSRHPNMAVILLCADRTPEVLIAAMRAGVREVLPSPAAPAELEEAVNRIAAKLQGAQPRSAGKILAFISCKGGCGATFLATNFGYQLATDKSVLLVDLNLQFGDALTFVHDAKPATTLADLALRTDRLDATLLEASTVKITPNYHILAAPEDPAQAVDIKAEHIETILDLAVAQYDFVLLDVGRNLDPVTIKALDRATRIYAVLQPGLPYLRNAARLLSVFTSLGYPADKTEVIVNRFEKGGEIALDDIRRLLGTTHLHTVSNSFKEVNASINQGNPLIEMARSSAVARKLTEFAAALSPRQEENRGLLGRLFRRA